MILVAFYLSILTFYLGVLVYSLPIPVAGLKRWGPRLINDAFFVLSLASTIELILSFTDSLRSLLGGDWGFFMDIIKAFVLHRSNTIIFISMIGDLLKVVPGVTKVLSVAVNIASASLYATLLMYFLALLVYSNIGMLTSLGLALMAIPFRIARNAGAYLLSFSLVFYLALPLYPNFMILLATPMSRSALDFAIIYGDAYTETGYKLTEGFIGLDIGDEYVGPARFTSSGQAFIMVPRKYISFPATIYFDATSHRFYTNVSDFVLANICRQEFTIHTCRVDLLVKGVLYYSNGMTIHAHPKPTLLESPAVGYNYIEFKAYLYEDTELYISVVNGYRVTKVIINSTTLIEDVERFKAYSWVWYNVPGRTYKIPIQHGLHTIRMEYQLNPEERLEPETGHLYPAKVIQADAPSIGGFLDALAYSAYLDIISSILYLSLLASITYGLARLLGGSYRMRLIP